MPELYPDTEITADTLSGQITYLQENDTTDWYTSTDDDTDNELHVGMQDPSGELDGQQSVDFHVRITSNGNNDPDLEIYLYENGSQISQLGTTTVTSTSGETITHTFDATDVSNGADVEFDLVGLRTGGMTGSRDVPEYGYITWTAQLLQEFGITTQDPRNVDTTSATLVADADYAGYDGSADVWFEWGPLGEGLPNTTTTQQISSGQEVTHDLTSLSENTEYEYEAHISHDTAGSDTGGVVSFWTDQSVSGVVTLASDGSTVEGADVYVVDVSTDERLAEVTSAADGTWSATVPGGHTLHAAVDHVDGDDYHAESYPYVD